MKIYLSLLTLLLLSLPVRADLQFTPEQCIFLYGNTAAQAAVNRDSGVSLEKALRDYDNWLKANPKIDPKREEIRIDKDILKEVYGPLAKKSPQEIFEIKAKECLKNKGIVKPQVET